MLNTRRNILILKKIPRFSSQPARPLINRSLGGIARVNSIYVQKYLTQKNPREVETIMTQSTNAIAEPTARNVKSPIKEKILPPTKPPVIPTILKGGAKFRKRRNKEETAKHHFKCRKFQKGFFPSSKKSFAKKQGKEKEKFDKDRPSSSEDEEPRVQENEQRGAGEKSKEKEKQEGKKKEEVTDVAEETTNLKDENEEEEDEEDSDDEIDTETDTDDENLNSSDSEYTENEEKTLAAALLHPLKVFFI